MKNIIKSIQAEGYIDTVVCVIATVMVIVLALNVFAFLTLKQDLDYFAKEIIDTATTFGRTKTEVSTRYNELAEEVGFSPTVSYDGSIYYNKASGKVQLGDTITVTLTYKTYVRGLGVFKIPITLSAKHSGLSQKYWK